MHELRPNVLVILLLLLAPLPTAGRADDSGVRSDREGARHLPLPVGEDAFQFVVFGDRTGGPPEGLRVLEQAVKDTNLLGPDLVMTVGDLINGYCATDEWMRQMREFRAIMDGLEMPWFPVAGNHDIYWRGEGRPPEEHERRYEEHFGPVWYWFEHKRNGFLVLFTDEGDGEGTQRNFSDESQIQFSERQLSWIGGALEAMKPLEGVFVFLHHPRWMEDRYRQNNWSAVHRMLVGAGNVRAVFAGHIHRMHYAGKRDGIEYLSLATTGGSLPGEIPYAGLLHHMNLVTVRRGSFHVATLPVGSVIDPREFTYERWKDIDLARGVAPSVVSGPVRVDESGKGSGVCSIVLRNPSSRPVEGSLVVEHGLDWLFSPDHHHVRLEPGEELRLESAFLRKAIGFERVDVPSVRLELSYLAETARVALPERTATLSLDLVGTFAEEFFATGEERCVELGAEGKPCVRIESGTVDQGAGPLTVEAWIRAESLAGDQSIVAKTESSEWGLTLQGGKPTFLAHVGGKYHVARSTEPLVSAGRWHHVAGVWDGREVRVYLDGAPVAAVAAEGALTRNSLPIYVGNDPDGKGAPASTPFRGRIDEVRISRGARYGGEAFEPATRWSPDDDTAVLHHFDRALGPFLPDHSASGATARLVGGASLVETGERRLARVGG